MGRERIRSSRKGGLRAAHVSLLPPLSGLVLALRSGQRSPGGSSAAALPFHLPPASAPVPVTVSGTLSLSACSAPPGPQRGPCWSGSRPPRPQAPRGAPLRAPRAKGPYVGGSSVLLGSHFKGRVPVPDLPLWPPSPAPREPWGDGSAARWLGFGSQFGSSFTYEPGTLRRPPKPRSLCLLFNGDKNASLLVSHCGGRTTQERRGASCGGRAQRSAPWDLLLHFSPFFLLHFLTFSRAVVSYIREPQTCLPPSFPLCDLGQMG